MNTMYVVTPKILGLWQKAYYTSSAAMAKELFKNEYSLANCSDLKANKLKNSFHEFFDINGNHICSSVTKEKTYYLRKRYCKHGTLERTTFTDGRYSDSWWKLSDKFPGELVMTAHKPQLGINN